MFSKLYFILFLSLLSSTSVFAEDLIKIITRNGTFHYPRSQLLVHESLIKTNLESKVGVIEKDANGATTLFVDVDASTMRLVLHFFSRGGKAIDYRSISKSDLQFVKADLDYLLLSQLIQGIQLEKSQIQTTWTCHAFCLNLSNSASYYTISQGETQIEGYRNLEQQCSGNNLSLRSHSNLGTYTTLGDACFLTQ